MLQFLLDTDHLTLFQFGDPNVLQRAAGFPPDVFGVTVVTAEEAVRGRLASVSNAKSSQQRVAGYLAFENTLKLIATFPMASFDQAAEIEYGNLQLLRLRVGTQDLKIAAIALARNCSLVTRNHRDFSKIPGLSLDDWTK